MSLSTIYDSVYKPRQATISNIKNNEWVETEMHLTFVDNNSAIMHDHKYLI